MAARKQGRGQPAARKPAARRGAQQERKVGYAVVGLGHFAQDAVLPAFAHAKKNSRLVALVSGDARKHRVLGNRYGVPVYAYEDLEDCLAQPEVEAAYIALPNAQHAEYTLRAARAGAHVLCEKPMALSEARCREMIATCDESDVRLMVGYRLHFDPANLAVVEAVRSGKLGEPRLFNSTFSYQVKAPNIRVESEEGGGVLWDIGLYCINATRYLFRDEPIEVSAFISRGTDERFADTEEAVAVLMRFPGDKLASFTVSFGAAPSCSYDLVCTQGRLRLENAYEYRGDMRLEVHGSKGKVRRRTFPEHDQVAPELTYFSRCILENEEPEPNGWEGLADVRIITALYESARAGRPVALEPLEIRRRPTQEMARRHPPLEAPASLVDVSAPTTH